MTDRIAAKPLVSIVLPTYKRAHVLPDAIRSVLDQTWTNFELIIVDDNSPDNTPEVVASFDDPRIRYVRNDPNLKLPGALNRGFSLARGDFLTWTSDDNLYAATAIERMVTELQRSRSEFVYADYYLFADVGPDGRPQDVCHDRLPDTLQLERGNHIGACFMYTRKVYETVGDYDPDLFLVEDYDYFMRVAKQFCMKHIAEPLYYFRRDDDTLYISRFCEVKASDVLVRYKNGLLSESEVLETIVTLLLRNTSVWNNPWVRWSDRAIRRLSYRLTVLHGRMLRELLRRRMRGCVSTLLQNYRSRTMSFAETKDALCKAMQELGTITYRPQQFK